MAKSGRRHRQPQQQGPQPPARQQEIEPPSSSDAAAFAFRASRWQGPLPDPETLARYDEILPGLAERVIRRWEKQGEHRQGLEKFALEADSRRADRGQTCALVVALVGLGVTAFLGWTGNEIAATVVGAVDIGGLVGSFLYGTHTRSQERRDRLKALTGQQ